MISDKDRREVARRLRDSAEERMAVKGRGNGNSWSWLYRSIFGHHMETKKMAKGRYVEVAHRLADLIEPSKPEVRCLAEVKVDGERLEQLVHDAVVEVTGIDRKALLELADDMVGEKRDISCATCRADFGLACYDYNPSATCMEACLRYYARRIRAALGVDE